MPQTLSAKKALRQAQRRATTTLKTKLALKKALREVRKGKNQASLNKAFSVLDQAAKKKVIHPKKASRLKKRLAKLVKKEPVAKPSKRKKNRKSARAKT